MDAFGYYRVTGLSPKIICSAWRRATNEQLVALFFIRIEPLYLPEINLYEKNFTPFISFNYLFKYGTSTGTWS